MTHIRIKDFRSFSGEHDFDVANGVNYFVGPNNCGKSNLIRALELALDPDSEYVAERDRPSRGAGLGAPPTTRITLTFRVEGTSSPEKTLLKRAQEYEVAVRKARKMPTGGGIRTNAADREIKLATSFVGGGVRQTTFQAKGAGAGALPADNPLFRSLETQFRSVVRFGVVHSGEDLESLLKGKFKEILQLVISDHLSDEMAKAEAARLEYISTLQEVLLDPLRSRILDRVKWMFPEITVADLVPEVPTLSQTLSSVDVRLGDTANTQLADKGTGVRGAVLVSMLQYLAEQSRRSLVMAVEEPEAFLHPAGQEAIMGQLQDLAARTDVSLLVTTHSPYVISRRPDAQVTELRKDREGCTSRGGTATGDMRRAELLGPLYRDSGMAHVLERALEIPSNCRAVLITEGYTDGHFLRIGLAAAGRTDLLDGIHVIEANGAGKVVFQSVLARSATQLPVIALLDRDKPGEEARKKLEEFGMNKRHELLSLSTWSGACRDGAHDVEIEDLIPDAVVEAIIEQVGEIAAVDQKTSCGGKWHLALSKVWKERAIATLPALMRAEHSTDLVWLAEEINRRIDAIEASRASALRHQPPQAR